MDPIYVTGHRNPDTDSIVAAISYAALRNACGDREYEAACLGRVSDETQIVLDRFGFLPPKRITDLYNQVRDLDFDKPPILSGGVTMGRAWDEFQAYPAIASIPVVNEDGTLYGILSRTDIADYNMSRTNSGVLEEVPLFNAISVLEGKILNDAGESTDTISGEVTIALPQSRENLLFHSRESIVLCGNQPDMIRRALELNVSCLVLCQAEISEELRTMPTETCIISTPYDLPSFKRLLGDGSDFGVRFEYAEQPSPDGLAQAFIIGEKFIGNDSVCLVLGDNIFHGNGLSAMLRESVRAAEEDKKATVFGYWVSDPERYGVAEFDKEGNCLSIEEKPAQPKSNYAVVGLYFYPNKVVEVAKNIKPSARGELEITTVNQQFLQDKELKVQTLGRGFAWLDTGTHDSLAEASTYIEVIEKRQGLKVACLEGIALRKGWITPEKMQELAQPMLKNQYGQYLLKVIKELGLE